MSWRRGILAVALLCASLDASAQRERTATLFGVTIGREIDSYPACESPEGAQKICVLRPLSGMGVRYIELRPEKPEYLRSNLAVTVKNGRITMVSADTPGERAQGRLLDIFTTRYGKPTTLTRDYVQNRFGAVFERINATWALEGGQLILRGMEDRVDQGSVGLVADRP